MLRSLHCLLDVNVAATLSYCNTLQIDNTSQTASFPVCMRLAAVDRKNPLDAKHFCAKEQERSNVSPGALDSNSEPSSTHIVKFVQIRSDTELAEILSNFTGSCVLHTGVRLTHIRSCTSETACVSYCSEEQTVMDVQTRSIVGFIDGCGGLDSN